MKKAKKVKKRKKENRPELKPCPFCGGEAIIEDVVYNYAVMCTRCRCETRWEPNEDAVIDIWNRRSTMDGLKPCPFCGNTNLKFTTYEISPVCYLSCDDCGAEICLDVDWDDMDEEEHEEKCHEVLAAAWNRRNDNG